MGGGGVGMDRNSGRTSCGGGFGWSIRRRKRHQNARAHKSMQRKCAKRENVRKLYLRQAHTHTHRERERDRWRDRPREIGRVATQRKRQLECSDCAKRVISDFMTWPGRLNEVSKKC